MTTQAQNQLTAAQIRQRFIDFFAAKPTEIDGHPNFPSSPVVPHDDPTLLFTNAGMNQYKPLFLGQADPSTPLGRLKRAANTQKCIRAGGKHNDLDDVGKDTYHHTFFEMLGNWSFGDYFKAEAIAWAWEFLTSEMKLPVDRLYATYFEGDPAQGLEPDDEARELWLRFLPEDRVLPGDAKDNFWEMGDTGPCGPCSEIHYDRVGGRDAAGLVNQDDPDVIEVWNLVFIQFNRDDKGRLSALPAKHVDTGMGLERLVSVLQDKPSNYDTDLFTPLFDAIRAITGARAYTPGGDDANLTDEINVAYRVVADHIRTLTFAIADGASPSNEGRGYVLRRILRRAVRYGRQKLGAETGFLEALVPTVVAEMKGAFPELAKNESRVREIIKDEEESFGRTLGKGTQRLGEFIWAEAARRVLPQYRVVHTSFEEYPSLGILQITETATDETVHLQVQSPEFASSIRKYLEGDLVLRAEDAFQLYDTFGFPIDLTQIMIEECGLTVDIDGFHRLMEEARERSRASSMFKSGGAALDLPPDAIGQLESALRVEPTNDSAKFERLAMTAKIEAIWNGADWDNFASHNNPRPFGIVLNRTCFYAEMGGQAGDAGDLFVTDGGEFVIEDTKSFGRYVLHIGTVKTGRLRVGDRCQINVDRDRRARIERNHTATHLLNHALRKAVSAEADQRGSLVAPDRLRFDFAHTKPVSAQELGEVETLVNAAIDADHEVCAELARIDEARVIHGLRAVFGETYPDPVRVVSIGALIGDLLEAPEDERWANYSVEFCGGTHVKRTGDISAFALVAEEAVAKGIRRVVALTGEPAHEAHTQADALAVEINAAQETPDAQIASKLKALTQRIDEAVIPASRKAQLRGMLGTLEDRAKQAAKAAAAARAGQAAEQAKRLVAAAPEDAKFIADTLDAGADHKALQSALEVVTEARPDAAVMLVGADTDEDKLAIVAACPKGAIDAGLKAGDWVKAAAAACGGRGGGKPQQAQGGGAGAANLPAVLDASKAFADEKLG